MVPAEGKRFTCPLNKTHVSVSEPQRGIADSSVRCPRGGRCRFFPNGVGEDSVQLTGPKNTARRDAAERLAKKINTICNSMPQGQNPS